LLQGFNKLEILPQKRLCRHRRRKVNVTLYVYQRAMTRFTKKPAATSVQYAALPYRRRGTSRTEVMLITSRETGRWVIPKGWPKKRRAPYASAAREALEEAGVVGEVERSPIGSYSYKKHLKRGRVVICQVDVFLLKVKRIKKHWPEEYEREAQWFSRAAAAEAVGEPLLSDIIRKLRKR
jgi:8-oxo-dGTP pyrophosphatase MutT (NUDIX family)